MRASRFTALLLAACLSGSAATAAAQPGAAAPTETADTTTLTLDIGEQHVLPAAGVRSYSEGARGVVDVRLTRDASEFVLVALAPGKTSLLFILEDGSRRQYRIEVSDPAKPASGAMEADGVAPRDNVRLDFYFVQLDRSYQHRVGIGWPATIGGGSVGAELDLLTQRFTSATAVVTDQPLPRLDMAQATGWAKLRRHAALIAANGERATFTGGGEVNIPLAGGLSTGIHQIQFGSSIVVQPRYDAATGRLELYVHAEVSDLTDDHGSGAPGRVTATLDTVVNLELGQSLVLAGLSASSEAGSRAGLPVLSQIPIFGALFGTHAKSRQDSDNLVMIVPSVVDAASLDARRRIQEALSSYEEYSGSTDQAPLLDGPPPRSPRRPEATLEGSR